MLDYSEKLIDHFENPRNVGELPDADGIGQVGDRGCGDSIKVWIKVRDEHIVDIKFKCRGCPAAIATASAMTELAKGIHVDEAAEITDEMISDAVGGLSEQKEHCSSLGATALYEAVMDYVFRSVREVSRDRCR